MLILIALLTGVFFIARKVFDFFKDDELFDIELQEPTTAKAWQINSYGDVDKLSLQTVNIPNAIGANEVIVKVEASSVNPIDVALLRGYARSALQVMRRFKSEFPLVLGRDFSGTVIYKGPEVGEFNVGDKVYGLVPLHRQGSFSEIVVVDKSHICQQPTNIKAVESASLVYTCMTAWSSTVHIYGDSLSNGARVLILGASGGVGTVAVQILKSQNCIVHGSCSTDAIPLVQRLGADLVFDYKNPDYLKNLEAEGFYDVILDCAQFGYDNVPKGLNFGTFVTLNSPVFLNTGKYGLIGGLLVSAFTLLKYNFKLPSQKKYLRWGFFTPSGDGLKFINKLISEGKIQPLIHKEFKFGDLPKALDELKNGHMRGKIVLTY